MFTSRRTFLALAGSSAFCSLTTRALAAGSQSLPSFSFLFITDTHLQPELRGVQGCGMAFRRARTVHADFAIQGGDHIYDGLAVPLSRSSELFATYHETEQVLGLKTYHAIGNHDVIGLYPKSGMNPGDAGYGKAYFEQHIGPRYQSFNHKGVHFIVLDSIAMAPERTYYGLVDEEQMAWLKADLAGQPAAMPIIVVTHIPMITAYAQYIPPSKGNGRNSLSITNAYEIVSLFEGRNVLAVLQGHTHVNERIQYRGVQYLTGGAVCGNWWEGVHRGTPEGYTVCTVSNGKLSTRYETYGFKADFQGRDK